MWVGLLTIEFPFLLLIKVFFCLLNSYLQIIYLPKAEAAGCLNIGRKRRKKHVLTNRRKTSNKKNGIFVEMKRLEIFK